MGVLLAALSAILYGAADFMGGLASRTDKPLAVTWSSQVVGLALVTVVAFLVPAPEILGGDLAAGAVAGLAGAVGLLLLYRALSMGPMAVVAPTTAVFAAVVPVVAGVVGGDRPGVAAGIGILIAFPGIVLAARGVTSGEVRVPVRPQMLVEAIVAGMLFGLFMVAFARVGEDAGLWPAVAARVASVGLLTVVGALTRSSLLIGRRNLGLVAATGAFDISSNVLYLMASRLGLLSVISVISAMYPASTVALARVVLHERIGRLQAAGLALIAIAVGLVVLGR